MIRILIAEDSAVVAMLLKAMFEQEDDLQVIGHARDGREAVAMAASLKPDLITMDIRMPVMDGFQATQEIMSTQPVPIVVISSSVDDEEMRITFRAVEEGALAVIEKPHGIGHPDFEAVRRELVNTVRAMAEVKLVRRRRSGPRPHRPPVAVPAAPGGERCELIAIGASTGGPQALRTIFSALPPRLPVPVAVVQHIGSGFLQGLVDWLNQVSGPGVRLAEHGGVLEPGQIYFAPEDRHLLVERVNGCLMAVLKDTPPVDNIRPSVTPLFESVARTCRDRAVGILLSGMGTDGARGMLSMRKAGCRTLVQDQESCVVFGMPGAALANGAAEKAVPLNDMARKIICLAGSAAQGVVS